MRSKADLKISKLLESIHGETDDNLIKGLNKLYDNQRNKYNAAL